MHQQSKTTTQKILNGVIALLVLIILLLIGYYFISKNANSVSSTQTTPTLQSLMPSSQENFTYRTIDGDTIEMHANTNQFKIKGMEGKLVFLKVFGWECQYCQKEIPELIKLKRDLQDEFEVIAIEAEHASAEESRQERDAYGINYPIIAGDEYFEFYDYLQAQYAWSRIMPLTMVIGKEGNVLAFEVGAKSYSLSELMKASLIKDKHSSQS